MWANKGTVTVDTASSGNDGIGVYAMGGSKVTVRGNATGQNNGVYATDSGTMVTVNGNATSTDGQIQGAVYALNQAEIIIGGNVSATFGYGAYTSNSGVITVEGDVYGIRAGALTEGAGGSITVKGDLSSYNHCAVITSGSSGNITVEGAVTPQGSASYVLINNVKLAQNEGTPDSGKSGYLKYSGSGATGVVWVKDATAPIFVSNAAELKDALGNVADGGTIRLTANINYSEKIVVDTKSLTLDVGTFTLNLNVSAHGMTVYALELKNSGNLDLSGTGEFNINVAGANTSAGVYANAGCSVTVTNVKVNVASGSAFGVYANGSGSQINVLGDVEVTGTTSGCGAKTWGTGQIRIEGIMTAPVYINLNSVYKAKDSGVVDNGYLKYSAEANGPGIVWVKIAPAVCEIVDGAQYDNLPEALSAAGGKTIRLLKDIIYEKTVSGDSAIEIDGKTITLDLNGYSLSILNPSGHGLAVVNNANLNITGTGNLSLNAKFAALYVTGSAAFASGGDVDTTLKSSYTVGIDASYQSAVNIRKGVITGASGGIYTLGYNNNVSFGGPITVNGKDGWECHGIHLSGNYTGNAVSVSGDINIASGFGAGIYVENGGTVIVGSQQNPVSVTSTGSAGIWTRQGSNTADITVYGDVTSKASAIYATGDADIKVFGNVKSTSTLASVYAAEGMANSGDTIVIAITGNVEGPNGVKYHGNEGTISVTGNVVATGSAGDTVGVFASYGSVWVTGNIAAPNGVGAEAGENGEITIDGVLTGNAYVKVYYVTKTASDKEADTTKEGYHTYKKDSAVVWVKDGAPATAYLLTVQNGTGGGSYLPGTPVNITANPPAQGKVFDKWTTSNGGSFGDANSTFTTFTMPSGAVTVTATYKDAPVRTYTLTVGGSYAGTSGAGQYAPGTQVSIHAGSRSNYSFAGWTTSGDGSFADASSASTTFIMLNSNATVTANWTYNGGGSGSSSSGGSPTTLITILPEKKPGQPVTAAAPITAAAGANGAAYAIIPDKIITDAIIKAQADAEAQGKTKNGISVELNVTMPKNATSLTVTLTQSSLSSLVNAGVTSLKINGYPAMISFDKKALTEIQKQSSGDVTITIKPAQNLSAEAKKLIGARPVYDITLNYVKNGKTHVISAFNGGIATISILYKPSKNEATGYLYGVHMDAEDNAARIDGSIYDTNESAILISTGHLLPVYGAGYTEPSAKLTDIETHWGKESIDYVVGRGLLSGTSETAFAPNTDMTRGMLVTALGRLAGVDVKAYSTNSFTDIKADSPFRSYIEWAYGKGIVQGIGSQQFAPDRAITREEIAVIFANYAKSTGYKLPVTCNAAAYEDDFSIGSVYKTAITAMQQAGIMMGGSGNKFNPKSSATRAEVSCMLHRYIKLTIDPATAQGWALNDAGQYLYYKDSNDLTGTQTIDGVKYFFNTGGTLKTGWVKDGDNWRYYSGNKASVGWLDISDKRYYFTKDGLMVSGKWLQIDSEWYYFYIDGSIAKNTKVDGYEVDINGVRITK